MITTMMMMTAMVMMTMMIQVVGVSQSKKSSRVQSRVGSLAPSRYQNVIIIMAMILMIRRKQLIPVTRVSDVVKGENDLLQTYCGNRNAQARLHGSFEGSIPRWKQDGQQVLALNIITMAAIIITTIIIVINTSIRK